METTFCVLIIILCNMYIADGNCTQSLAEDLQFNSRLYNSTFLSIRNIGMHMCISECVKRPLCRSVNFDQIHFTCELNSIAKVNLITPMTGFTFVNLSNKTDPGDACSQCLVGEQCITTLLSNRMTCVDDDTIRAKDCTDITRHMTSFQSGIYRIRVSGIGLLNVYCDMDSGIGGWLVFQRRLDGTTDFYRNWTDYKTGFGNLSGEFWLGNDILHYILKQGEYQFRMNMGDFDGATRYVKYHNINIGDEASGYLMSISGHSGNVADCFNTNEFGMNNQRFSTKDKDNDKTTSNCATLYKGAWWYNDCHCANPNGLYLAGQNTRTGEGVTYGMWRGQSYSLKTVTLMIRKK